MMVQENCFVLTANYFNGVLIEDDSYFMYDVSGKKEVFKTLLKTNQHNFLEKAAELKEAYD
jgi:hypothetical protein